MNNDILSSILTNGTIHQSYIIGIVDKGKRIITTGNAIVEVNAGEVFFINPGQVHSCRSEKPCGHAYRILCVSTQYAKGIQKDHGDYAARIPDRLQDCPIQKNAPWFSRYCSHCIK